MGTALAPRRLQGGRQALSEAAPRYATVVPDVTGIDKEFDYLVPETIDVAVGDKVRVVLHGRRVGAWVVSLSDRPLSGLDSSRISPIAARSGPSVAPDVVALSSWIADRWFGPRRAVLSSASAPRLRPASVHSRRGRISSVEEDSVSTAVVALAGRGGGCLRVPPAVSVLPGVMSLASRGPVLVVCPTMRMASLGAAWLRRRGAEVAVLPDDWDLARAGVDVVIGARSAVLAPCAGVSAIVVIDAHDESLQEERSPSWDAHTVAIERGRRLGVPVVATSPIPPAAIADSAELDVLSMARPWGRISVEDLADVPVAGSLLGSGLLSSVRDPKAGVLCILNTKGAARLVACRTCTKIQRCPSCDAALSVDADILECRRCGTAHGSVCVSCGATTFKVLRTGISGLSTEIARSTGVVPVEVSAESSVDVVTGTVFVGTEGLLNRVGHADTVVFCDIDRDLGAPRVTAPREVLALVAKAARIVGGAGTVIIQTRDPGHPVLRALARDDVDRGIAELLESDLSARRELGLPPHARVVNLSGPERFDPSWFDGVEPLDHQMSGDVLTLRSPSDAVLREAIEAVVKGSGAKVRVYADPSRF